MRYDVMDNGLEYVIRESGSNSSRARNIYLGTKTIGKGMNPSFPLQL